MLTLFLTHFTKFLKGGDMKLLTSMQEIEGKTVHKANTSDDLVGISFTDQTFIFLKGTKDYDGCVEFFTFNEFDALDDIDFAVYLGVLTQEEADKEVAQYSKRMEASVLRHKRNMYEKLKSEFGES